MAKAKGITARTISKPTKVPPVWQIGIIFPDEKIYKSDKPIVSIYVIKDQLNEIQD